MTMPFELFVALRYLLARRKQAFISLISLISMLGVAVGVMALLIALALMTGLQGELRDRILGSAAHVYVFKAGGIEDYRRRSREAAAAARACSRRGAGADRQGDDHQRRSAWAFIDVKGIDPALRADASPTSAVAMRKGSLEALARGPDDDARASCSARTSPRRSGEGRRHGAADQRRTGR